MARRYYSSIAQRTTLSGSILSGSTTIAVVAVTGFPSTKPYTLILDQDTVNEEVVTVTASSGTTLTVTRGVDGTTGVAHSAGATVNHGVSARDFDEPNAFLNAGTLPLVTAKGDLLAATASGDVDALAVGTNDDVLTADSAEATGMKWGAVPADATKADKNVTQNPQTGTTYTFVLTDVGKIVTASNAAAQTYTVPPQADVVWLAGAVLDILNLGAGTVTIAAGAGVTINGTPLTLATSKGGSLVRTASNVWTFVPFSGGSNSPVVDEGASTNVTFSTLTNPDSDSKNYRLAVWNSNGTLVVTTPGQVAGLLVGGPAALGGFNGNAGDIRTGFFNLPSGTLTVTRGASASTGTASSIATTVVTSVAGLATNTSNCIGGGGTSANLQLGFTSSITGASVVYARAQITTPVANRGDAGSTPGQGSDGVVIIRWEI